MVNSTQFAKRLDKIIAFYGLTATSFSEKIEVNRSTISHLLSGRNKPSLEFVMKVTSQFKEVDLYWLLNGTGFFPFQKNATEKNSVAPNKEIAQVEKKSISEKEILEKTKFDMDKISRTEVSANNNIEKIVFFYKDGTFKSYEN